MANAKGEAVAEYMRQYYRAHSTRPPMIPGATRESKVCRRCGVLKLRSEFTIRKTGPHIGHMAGRCKQCAAEISKHAAATDATLYRRVQWPSKLKRLYGITVDDYYRMLAEQGGGCALCGSITPDSGSRRYKKHKREVFDVDHCHTSGKVRGLLCTRCNRLVGLAKDDIATVQRLMAYLARQEV